MHRTQIYLSDDEAALLAELSARTGASRSELIRRAIGAQYAAQPAPDRLAALQASAGVWQGRPFTGERYVATLRGDLNERLAAVGLP